MAGCRRWISSMKSTSPFSRLVRSPASSPAFSTTGPLVFLMFTPIALAMMWARVVLPSPDGPLNRMCSSTSPRFLAASTINSSRSRTFTCPVNSLNAGGRSEISKAVSDSGGFIGDAVLECSSNGVMDEKFSISAHSNTLLLQLFRQHQLGTTALVDIIHLVKGVANQVKTEPARFDQVVRAAFHFVRYSFVTIIPQAHAYAFA